MKSFFIVDEPFRDALNSGLQLSLGTLVATVFLELICWETVVFGVWKQPQGKELYWQAWLYNLNHIVFGVPVYMIAALVFCTPEMHRLQEDEEEGAAITTAALAGVGRNVVQSPLWQQYMFGKSMVSMQLPLILQVSWVILLHALQYYAVHKAFHESSTLYQTFHRFHHRFNVHTPPSAANAVTVGEYVVAYVLPFIPPVALLPVSPESMKWAVAIASALNLLVHCPKLEQWSKRWVPFFWVSTHDHLDHHRKLNCHYASPTLNVDNILDCFAAAPPKQLQEQPEDEQVMTTLRPVMNSSSQ